MILAVITVSSVAPVFQSAILGYHLSVLAYILGYSRRFRGSRENDPPNRSCGAVPGNGSSALREELLAKLRANPSFREAPKDGQATVILGARP